MKRSVMNASLATNKCACIDLHIISNGSPSCLYLGKTCLNFFALNSYAYQLKMWSVSNILLYGCNVAARNFEKEFRTAIAFTFQVLILAHLYVKWMIQTKVFVCN